MFNDQELYYLEKYIINILFFPSINIKTKKKYDKFIKKKNDYLIFDDFG